MEEAVRQQEEQCVEILALSDSIARDYLYELQQNVDSLKRAGDLDRHTQVALTELLMQVQQYSEQMKQEEYAMAQFVQRTIGRFQALLTLQQKLLKVQNYLQQPQQKALRMPYGAVFERVASSSEALERLLQQYPRDLRLPSNSAHNVINVHCTKIDLVVVNQAIQYKPLPVASEMAAVAATGEDAAMRLQNIVGVMRALTALYEKEMKENCAYMAQHQTLCQCTQNDEFLYEQVKPAFDAIPGLWHEQLGGAAHFDNMWNALVKMRQIAQTERTNLQLYVTNSTLRFIECAQTYDGLLSLVSTNNNIDTRHIVGGGGDAPLLAFFDDEEEEEAVVVVEGEMIVENNDGL